MYNRRVQEYVSVRVYVYMFRAEMERDRVKDTEKRTGRQRKHRDV